ncbi:MAG TPA: CHAT domain-containing protein, partial [Pyrinomonadaceae bacterium]|nr:CHAT domain-containing protein [Pyrinomonadaceae bacterium]
AADKITSLGREFGKLRELKTNGNELTLEQQKRYAELDEQLIAASRNFENYRIELAKKFPKRFNIEKEFKGNEVWKADLEGWSKETGENIVYVYTLVGKDRYHAIVYAPYTQTHSKTEIKAKDLNAKIFEFRNELKTLNKDPRQLGKELYDILIKPIERQLEGTEAKTILWSQDGNLRLVPLAALWDGKQYFGQKYQNVTVTLASRSRLGKPVSKNWLVLGLGVSEGKKVKDPNGTRDIVFDPLTAVRDELLTIVKTTPDESGVLPGKRFLNSVFTKRELKNQLPGNYKVVHIASHFSLYPGDETNSFLLLGDGDILTVNQLRHNQQLFVGVELLTLSACDTAIVEKDSTGKEIEGFGYVAQDEGAQAILATLWKVADESTQIFMSEFYRLRAEHPEKNKAEIIRLVQKEMIEGKIDAKYTHPYFWSPFVLIGNWR